jgi:hypothetical protein
MSSPSGFTGSGSSSGSSGGAAALVPFPDDDCTAAAAPFPDRDGCGGAAAADGGCFGGGMRTRKAGPILPRNSAWVGNNTMILSASAPIIGAEFSMLRAVMCVKCHRCLPPTMGRLGRALASMAPRPIPKQPSLHFVCFFRASLPPGCGTVSGMIASLLGAARIRMRMVATLEAGW